MARIYLNHASETPLLPAVRARMVEYLDRAMADPDAAPIDPQRVRHLLGRLLGADPAEIALTGNTTAGIGLVAAGLDWRPGDNVVLPAEQFPANALPWLALEARGVEVRLVPPVAGRWTPADLAARVDGRTRVVAVSSVEFLTGFRGDLVGTARLCRDAGALLVVDAIQSAGALPHGLTGAGIDVLCAGGYKWLMGPVGTGFVYVRREAQDRLRPVAPGAWAAAVDFNAVRDTLRLHPDARRFEGGNLAWPAFHGWTAALEQLLAAGPAAVWQRIQALTDRLVAGLQGLGIQIASPLAPAERSGIVSFTLGGTDVNRAAQQRLYAAGVVVAYRGGLLRASPHYTNSAEDIDGLLTELARQV